MKSIRPEVIMWSNNNFGNVLAHMYNSPIASKLCYHGGTYRIIRNLFSIITLKWGVMRKSLVTPVLLVSIQQTSSQSTARFLEKGVRCPLFFYCINMSDATYVSNPLPSKRE